MSRIVLNKVRLSYPDLWKPGKPMANSAGEPKYGAQFIFDVGSDAARVAEAAFLAVARDKWGANGATVAASLEASKKCIRKGDSNLDKDGNVRNGYAGKLYLVAKNKIRPVIVDRKRLPLTEADGKPYGGCYVNASVEIYAMDKPGQGKSINATLLAVQFDSDGEAFGGGVGSADVFADLGDDEVGAENMFG